MKISQLIVVLLLSILSNAYSDNHSDSLELQLTQTSGEEKFNTLMNLTRYLSRFDLKNSLEYAKESYDFAVESENQEWIATSLNGLAIVNYNLGKNQVALNYFNRFIDQIKAMREEDPNSALYLNKLLTGYNNIGNIHKSLGDYEKAMRSFINALKIMEELPKERQNASLHIKLMNNLGTVYLELGEYDKAKEILNDALQQSRNKEMMLEISITLNNLGLVAIQELDYEPALQYYLEAIKIGRKLKDSIGLGGYHNNIGQIYENQQQWKKALDFYNNSLQISRNLGYKWGIANTLGNIGKIRIELAQYDEAEKSLTEALAIAKKTGIKELIQKIYSYLFELNNRQSMAGKALHYHLLYSSIKDSLFNEEKSRQIAEMETRYEAEKKERENDLLKKDIEVRKANQHLSLVVMAGLIVLAALLFLLFRIRTRSLKKEKQIRQLEHEKNEIEKKRLEEQIFAEQQINRLQKEKLEQKNRELSTNVLHIMNKNNALKEILKQMENIKVSRETDKNQCFNKVSTLINNNLNLDNDWEQFKLHFDEVHPSFFTKLNNNFPKLTANEQRLCAYLRINLNSKEIAQMLNVSPDAVIKSRYRLRKKLEVTSETDLVEFMNKI